MVAEIVSVGTELLLGQITDTDAQYLGKLLAELGIAHRHRQTVGDNLERLTEALSLAHSRSDIVITIGGLGPTEDDLTREGVSAVLAETLQVDQAYENTLREYFVSRNLAWVSSQSRQAMKPPSAQFIANPNGSAPGIVCSKNGKTIISMPGPPGEFRPMADGPVRTLLSQLQGIGTIHSLTLRTCGIGEGALEAQIRHLLASQNPTVAPYAHPAEVHLRITARADSELQAMELIRPIANEIRCILGDAVYGENTTTFEESIVAKLMETGKSVAVAESCTGGMLGARITSVSGSSAIFPGGVISYSNEIKHRLIGVSTETLSQFGAVSEECCAEMAEGAKSQFRTTFGLSITGIAGPDGGTPDKPVGLVYVGISDGTGTIVRENRFRGLREDIRRRSTQASLMLLRDRLLGKS